MIAAVCGAPCALQRRTESGLQARPLLIIDTEGLSYWIPTECDAGVTLVV
jgi:hypothetical protein